MIKVKFHAGTSSLELKANPGPKFTNHLNAILRQFSDLRQSYNK